MAGLCKSREMTLFSKLMLNGLWQRQCSRFASLATPSQQTQCFFRSVPTITISISSRKFLLYSIRESSLSRLIDYQKGKKFSTYGDNFIAKFSEEIDLDALREKKIRELKDSGEIFHVNVIVKQIIAEKCDEVISNLSEEDKKKLNIIQLEHDFLFSEGYAIPSKEEMTSENWLEALNLSSKHQRLKFYIFKQKKKFKKDNMKKKKAEKAESTPEEGTKTDRGEIKDDKIFLRTYKSTMKRWQTHRLSTAMQFGLPLVIDMAYDDVMKSREVRNTASQILAMYTVNRGCEQMPFHLHLTSCLNDNTIYRNIQLLMQDDPHLMATVTPQSYMDLFDKDQLVYLSPNGKQVMREFDPNAVYIIGAFNDKAVQKPVSYARAKEQGIKCQSLPLDHYLQWNVGGKALALNQMMSILVFLKNGYSWSDALTQTIPSRKFRDGQE